MTMRLPFYVTISLLAHLALLLAWRTDQIALPQQTETALQISLLPALKQIASTSPAPVKKAEQEKSSSHALVKSQQARKQRRESASKPAAPVTASAADFSTVATTPVATKLKAKTESSDTAKARLQTQMRLAFNRYFSYPALARRNGWNGVVKISLRLEADGRLSEVRLIQSSGHSSLDAAAVASAQRIPPQRDAISWLQGTAHVILLPVEYRLIDG